MKMEANLLLSSMIDNEAGQRGYILSQMPAFLEPYDHSLAVLPSARRQLEGQLNDPKGRAVYEQFSKSIDARLAFAAQTVALQTQGAHEKSVALVQTGRGKQLMDQVRADAAALDQYLDRLAGGYEQEYAANVQWDELVSWLMVAADGVLVAMLIVLLLRLRRTSSSFPSARGRRRWSTRANGFRSRSICRGVFGFSISHGISPEEAKKLLGSLPGQVPEGAPE